MKKIFSLLIVSTFLMGTTAFGDTFKVESNGTVKDMELTPVNVTYNGISIDKRTPAVIYNERTLLPVRVLSEATGASVKWISETKSIVLTKGSKTIEMKIGSTKVNVNGKSKKIAYGVPPMLVNDSALVPLRFISEELGLNIDWNEASFTAVVENTEHVNPSTVSGVSKEYVNGREAVVIRTNRAGLSRITPFEGKLAIDFINANFGFQKETSLDHTSVYRARASQYSDKSVYNTSLPVTRVVLDMNSGIAKFNYEIDSVDNNLVVYIDAAQNSAAESPQDAVSGDSASSSDGSTYTYYTMSLDQMLSLQSASLNIVSSRDGWSRANLTEIITYLDPSSIVPGSDQYFQFLDLSKPSGITADQLNNKILSDKGILSNTGASFVEAGRIYGVNDAYLVSHALLETGNGTSNLATGVVYNGKTVYNMFGIGAVDSNPLNGGAKTAYENGWFTPHDAIVGGAKFISEKYINRAGNLQNTLYEMRWNPDSNYVWHQYATDIGWAYKQVANIKKIYDSCEGYSLYFDVPVFK